jgi:hypothetical protein
MPHLPRAQVAAIPAPLKGTTSTAPPPDAALVSLGPPYRPRRASTPERPPPFAAQLDVSPLPLNAARQPEPHVERLRVSHGQACLAVAVGPHAGRVAAVPVGREPRIRPSDI